MRSMRNGRAVALGITGLFAAAGAAAGTGVATGHLLARTDIERPGLLAIVGWGITACGDNNKPQQQGATGMGEDDKTCWNTGTVVNSSALSSAAFVQPGYVSPSASVGGSNVAAGNAIGGSPMGIGASENNGAGA